MSGKTIDIRALHCPQCGAPAQVTPGEDSYLCRFCQTSFLIERPTPQKPANPYASDPTPLPLPAPYTPSPLPEPTRVVDLSPPRSSGGAGIGVFVSILVLVGIAVGVGFAVKGGGVLPGSWNGSKPLVCSGNEWINVDHVKAHFDQGVAIVASGNCWVTCKDCEVSAPTVVRAYENASVTFDHGTATGDVFDDVSQNASVTANHTKITGKKKEPESPFGQDMQEWPSSGPFVCSGSHEFKNVKVKVSSGAAIIASGNCTMKLSNCDIEGPVGLLLNDNATVELDDCEVHAKDAVIARANGGVTIENGTFVGTDHAALLQDNANLHAHGAKVEGSKSYSGNAEVEIE